MTIISETLHFVDINKIPDRLKLYEEMIQAAEAVFVLAGYRLEELCSKHSQNLMIYDSSLAECRTIEDTIKVKIEEIESVLYRNINETNQRALGTQEIRQYIKGEPRLVNAQVILLEVINVRRQLESIVNTLKSMGFSLGHIVKLRVAELDHVIL